MGSAIKDEDIVESIIDEDNICWSFVSYTCQFFLIGPDLVPAVTVSIICFIPLVLMRAVRNLVAPPIVIITDSKEFAFNFPTRYRIDVSIMNNKRY